MSAYAAAAKEVAKKAGKDKAKEKAADEGKKSAAARLRGGEESASRGERIASNMDGYYTGGRDEDANEDEEVVGDEEGAGGKKKKKKKGKLSKASSVAIIPIGIIIIVCFLTMNPTYQLGNFAANIQTSTDQQYTDAQAAKADVFSSAMSDGEVPSAIADNMKKEGTPVGYMENGEFVESNQGVAKVAFTGDKISSSGRGELVVKVGDKIVSASEFYKEYTSNPTLYSSFNNATYGEAAYYYDDEAERVFKELGMTRDDYNSTTNFKEVTSELMGEGNNIIFTNLKEELVDANTAGTEEDCQVYPGGEIVCIVDEDIKASGVSAEAIVNDVQKNSNASDATKATMDAADSLTVADTISTEQRSMKLYVAVMQNISKVKAGYGGTRSGHDSILDVFATLGAVNGGGSNINDVMNMLYEPATVNVVDVQTGQLTQVTGSMLQSPSLYSMLTQENVDLNSVQNYSNERILKTVENTNNASDLGEVVVSQSVASAGNKVSGQIYRYQGYGNGASANDISEVTPIVESSLTNNSFETVGGISGGELLAQGAVNLGAKLALQSGSTVGDAEAVEEYAKLTKTILALDAEADRMNRSPLDVRSKNTFLGSIVYKFAVSSLKSGSILNKVASISRVTASSIMSLIPGAYADEESEEVTGYLTVAGECERMDMLGAVGTAACSKHEVFDTSTYGVDFINSGEYDAFVNANLDCVDGKEKCTIQENSMLAKFIDYNIRRSTPIGVADTDIIKKEDTNDGGIIGFVKGIFGSNNNEETTRKANGKEYVNSSENPNWKSEYRIAQYYVSRTRAIAALRKYSGDETAFNFKGMGAGNPVMAYINEHYPLDTVLANN